jgi:glycosyltransferase involved in cell wall biosynthesis
MTTSKDVASAVTGRVRVAYLVSHPIQYQAPLLRRIAQEADIDLTVFFGSDFSTRGYSDKGFGGVGVKWDVTLLDGYKHEFLPVLRDNATSSPTAPINHGIFSRLRGRGSDGPFDLLWVHGYASVNALHGILAANALGIPVLLRAESTLEDRHRSWWKLLTKTFFFKVLSQLVDGVLPIGTRNALYWSYYLGDGFPAWLMPYAVDNAYFRDRSLKAVADRSALQFELGLDPARPVILFASKLQERKRCIDLLEAYLQLAPSGGAEPESYLLIVGDGEERAALEARTMQSGVKSIRFCGFRNQSELPRFFDLATVFVLPSHHEPWGLIVNEVMNAGRPIILTDNVGCQPDLITDGVEGFVVPAKNVPVLAAALRRVIEVPGAAEQMGQAALKRIQGWNFDADVRGLRTAISVLTSKIAPPEIDL